MILCSYIPLYFSFPSLDLDMVTGEHESSDRASTPTGEEEQLPEYSKELNSDLTKSETAGEMESGGGREVSGSEDTINIPSPIPELDELIQNDEDGKVCIYKDVVCGGEN